MPDNKLANKFIDKVIQVPEFLKLGSLVHGFSTLHAGDASKPEQAAKIIQEQGLNPEELQLMRQIHGEGICEINEINPNRPEADALVTNKKNIILGIRTADCVPILVFDPINSAIAAIHSGWKSAAKGLPPKVIGKLKELYGTDPENCRVVIGPAIGPCCYEVGSEVIEKFPLDCIVGNKFLNLPLAVTMQLSEAGIPEDQIFLVNRCTCCSKDSFFSHRRDNGDSRRHLSFIGQ